jgi:two-component system sensor histidine kinase BaeS
VGALLVANPENVDMIRDPGVSRLANAVNVRLLGAGLIAAIAGIFLIALMSRRILAPVHSLTSAARQLGQGNLAQRVGDSAPGEIGQLARTFNAMASNLEQAEIQRLGLVADIAHELRTPLSNVQGYLEAVKDGVLPPDKQTVDTFYQQVRHVVKLVDDPRWLALADAGVTHLDHQSSSIEDLLSQTAKTFRPTAAFKGVSLEIRLPGRLPLVSMDPTRIPQVPPICWIIYSTRRAEWSPSAPRKSMGPFLSTWLIPARASRQTTWIYCLTAFTAPTLLVRTQRAGLD